MTLWQQRLSAPPSDELLNFTQSLSFDRRLWRFDLLGSQAHARGLVRAGILSAEEGDRLSGALGEVENEFANGTFVFVTTDEDIHTAVERRVTEIAGELGARLHSGRSRNDQVATDLRLYVKSEVGELARLLLMVVSLFGDVAESVGDAIMPGYTHTQRAQPVPVAHHILAHGWALLRDLERLRESYHRLDVSPLGAGALAGTTLPIDPGEIAAELGFREAFTNSFDAVSERDFVVEVLFDVALLGVHLSRLSEEIVMWTTEEFGFVRLDDAYSTGSSMLPQKKNPDIAELARGKTGRFVGNLVSLLVTLKGLPLTYNRDLQEDKEPLFDSLDQMRLELIAVAGMVSTMTFDYGRMRQAAGSEYLQAIDIAEYLVTAGMPFRRAHGIAAGLVRDSLERRVSLTELVTAHPQLGEEAVSLLEADAAIRRRGAHGAASIASVGEQIGEYRSIIAELESTIAAMG
ncbi:MAG: argininosuccinate lyase [Ferrimicrobium sp.]